jgi:hypothetical protein
MCKGRSRLRLGSARFQDGSHVGHRAGLSDLRLIPLKTHRRIGASGSPDGITLLQENDPCGTYPPPPHG